MNYTLHTDLYQLNMAYSYFNDQVHEKRSVFELYFRQNPFNNGYAVFAGVERVVEVIEKFSYSEDDIAYLRTFGYSEEFLLYLKNFKFEGNIRCAREGEVVFANEPLLIVESSLIAGQLLETIILNIINFQTLIATKASRIKQLIPNKSAIEFGARRAQELDAALWGSRSAYIAGFDGTSLVSASLKFDIPVYGTHAHSFIQVYQDEYLAFKKYAQTHKEVIFLIDTYDSIKSGIVNAIKVADELKGQFNFNGVRIDSGDLGYTAKKVRAKLDEAGYSDVKIVVSNDLDESTIASLILENAPIDIYGIGTKLITAYDQPALGGVYKLTKIEDTDVVKISNNIEKITTPGNKKVFRVLNNQGKSEGDLISLIDEEITNLPLKLFSEHNPLIYKMVEDYTLFNIHIQLYENGKLVYNLPTIHEIKSYHQVALERIWSETLRYKNPAKYYVDLSEKCFNNKQDLIRKHKIV